MHTSITIHYDLGMCARNAAATKTTIMMFIDSMGEK